jgi:hypothetical protein
VLLGPQVKRERWFRVQLDLIGDLASLFHRSDVDVVILNEATPLLAYQIVQYGQVIYEDEDTRPAVDFAAYTISRYADTAPIRRLKERYLREWVRERQPADTTKLVEPHHW